MNDVPVLRNWHDDADIRRDLRAWREDGASVREVRLPDGPRVWLVTGYDESRQAFLDPAIVKDYRKAPNPQGFGRSLHRDECWAGPNSVITTDGSHHTRLRNTLRPFLNRHALDDLRPVVRDICEETLDALTDPLDPDLMRDFARVVTARVVNHILGIHPSHLDAVVRASTDYGAGEGSHRANAAIALLGVIVADTIEARRKDPDQGIVSALVADPTLTARDVLGIASTVVIGGTLTTSTLLGWGIAYATTLDDHRAVMSDPRRREAYIEEMLRRYSPTRISTWRFAAEATVIGDTPIPAGAVVCIAPSAANRDPRQFPDPDLFDPQRPNAASHLAFGHGVHLCIGAALARLEAATAYSTVFTRYPNLRLALDLEHIPWSSAVVEMHPRTLPIDRNSLFT
ncbi:cytochrome P450 [Kitasatospora sp. NPDC006697]|uniref:cytochrome P450 n=1 Tax=Kitasatospora sp. NPDC006697 TaxID=3364020 RepID=UPI0036C112FB